MRNIKTWKGFVDSIKSITKELKQVSEVAIARQGEMKGNAARQLLVAAHTELKQCNKILITSTKVGNDNIYYYYHYYYCIVQIFLEHPDDPHAQENREYVIKRMQEAVKTISLLADGMDPLEIQQEQIDDEEDQESEDEFEPIPPPTPPPPPPPPPLHSAQPSLPPSQASKPLVPRDPSSPPPPPHIPRELGKKIQTFEVSLCMVIKSYNALVVNVGDQYGVSSC